MNIVIKFYIWFLLYIITKQTCFYQEPTECCYLQNVKIHKKITLSRLACLSFVLIFINCIKSLQFLQFKNTIVYINYDTILLVTPEISLHDCLKCVAGCSNQS